MYICSRVRFGHSGQGKEAFGKKSKSARDSVNNFLAFTSAYTDVILSHTHKYIYTHVRDANTGLYNVCICVKIGNCKRCLCTQFY